MQSYTTQQKSPYLLTNELGKSSSSNKASPRMKESPQSSYLSSATHGKKIDETRNISITTSEPDQNREKAKYPIKIPVEQMKPQKSKSTKPKKTESSNRPVSAKGEKSHKEEKSNKKRKGSISKTESVTEDLNTVESSKGREGMARPQSAKAQKPLARPLSSRSSKGVKEDKRGKNLSIDKEGDEFEGYIGMSEVYHDELKEFIGSKKELAERAKKLMEENLKKYQEEVRRKEEALRLENEEKELKKQKKAEKAREILERARKNKTRSPSNRKGVWEPEPKKVEKKEHGRRQDKERENRDEEKEKEKELVDKIEGLAIAYGMENGVRRSRKKGKNEWDEEANDNKDKYNIKKKEKAPEEKERLRKLVQEQFEKKKKEEKRHKEELEQEKAKKRKNLDVLKRNVEEIQVKDMMEKHPELLVNKEKEKKKRVEKKESRKPLQEIRQDTGSQVMDDEEHGKEEGHEDEREEIREEEYEKMEELGEDVRDVEEEDRDDRGHEEDIEKEKEEDYEEEREDEEEREEFEELEKQVEREYGSREKYHRGKSGEKRAGEDYTLEPLGEITNSNNSSPDKLLEEIRKGENYDYVVEKSATKKKLVFRGDDGDFVDKENMNVQNYAKMKSEEKVGGKKQQPYYFEENVKRSFNKDKGLKQRDEKQENEEEAGNPGEELDFEDMLFNLSSEELIKLPYFSIVK